MCQVKRQGQGCEQGFGIHACSLRLLPSSLGSAGRGGQEQVCAGSITSSCGPMSCAAGHCDCSSCSTGSGEKGSELGGQVTGVT